MIFSFGKSTGSIYHVLFSVCVEFVLQQTEPGVFRVHGSVMHFFVQKYRKEDKTMQKTYLKQVGERLFECRTRNFFSRKELAERASVPISSVKMMERGEEAVGIEDALKICNELDCSAEYILTGNCGIYELIKLNQKILDLPESSLQHLEKMVQAFWNSCPKSFR
ncbi:MAG: helix-turn-helix transcriptional regulator [Acutalibacteraceae bacterium]|nr:helix-turn-helix transcriptional regulator [Acutalibacteraceae bacterium]